MQFLPYIHFFCFFTYAFFGTHILLYNRKAPENRVLSVLINLFALWSLAMVFVQNKEASYYQGYIAHSISMVSMVFVSGLFLWFHLLFTGNEKLAKNPFIFSLFTIIPLAILIVYILGDYSQMSNISYGWLVTIKPCLWRTVFLIYILTCVTIAWYHLYKFIKISRDTIKRKQAKILFAQNIIIMLVGLLIHWLLPYFSKYEFPQIGNAILMFWFPGILFAISKYKLFVSTPSNSQARKIIDTVKEPIIIINTKGNIQTINGAAARKLGYRNIDLFGKHISYLTEDEDLASAIKNKSFITKKDIELNLQDGSSLPYSATLSILTGNKEKATGYTLLLDEQADKTDSQKLEEEHLKTLQNLSEAAIGFVELPADEDIFQYIGEKLKETVGEALIMINAVDETLNISTTRAIYGLGRFTSQIMKIMGAHPLGNSYRMIESEHMPKLYSGKLVEFEGGLHELTYNQIPKSVCSSVEKLMKLDRFYGIAFVWNDVMYGNASIITFKDKPLRNKQFVETFAYQASIAVQKRIAEQALRFSEKKYKNYIDNSPDGIFVINSSGQFVEVNQSTSKLTNYPNAELLKMNIETVVAEESVSHSKEVFDKLVKTGKASAVFLFKRKGCDPFYMQVDATQITKDRFIAFTKDVTANIKANEKLKAALNEKDVLLKEVHHRVKNNMQVIISLINMQVNGEDLAPDVIEKFRVLQERVRTMSFIHEGLYNSKDLSNIDFGKYLERLTQNLMDLYATDKNIKLDLNIDNILFDINKAIPCGLAVNELISNALKYAFVDNNSEDKENIISLALKKKGDFFELLIADNGKGLPKNIDFENTDSLGLWLVNILVKDQLEGELKCESKQGTAYNISFPIQ